MKILKDKILECGKVTDGRILRVENFINHQMDIKLFNEMGKEFKNRFKDTRIDKILTIETSGIGIASIVSQYFDYVPVVFARKFPSAIISDNTYNYEVYSFTKNITNMVRVDKEFLNEGENILIIDDFLANGCAALGLINIVRQAKANPVGMGIVIEKGFQGGRKAIEDVGVRGESLAIIDRFEGDSVVFKEQ